MQKYISKQYKKILPKAVRLVRWTISTAFTMLELTALAWCVLYFVAAAVVIEVALAGITVFATLFFTKLWR